MPREQPTTLQELEGKEAVEQAIVTIYAVAETQAIDLTPIDHAVDLIRGALAIRLIDCSRCGETLLIEHAIFVPGQGTGEVSRLCPACAQRSDHATDAGNHV